MNQDAVKLLQRKLSDRPSPNDLLENHILQAPASLAPALHASFGKVEQAFEKRPSKEELLTANVLKNLHVAPSLQSNADSLQKAIVADSLKKGMEDRSQASDLYESNILKNSAIASKLQATASDLEKSIKIDLLKKAINTDK